MRRSLLLAVVLGILPLLGGLPLSSGAQEAPTAAFTVSPEDPDVNTEVLLDASASTSPDDSIVRYEWDLDGDGRFELSLERPRLVHLFEESGPRTVTLQVTDGRGRTATASRSVRVRPAPVTVRRTITTPLSPNRVPRGSAFQVTVTVRINEMVNVLGLDEDLPEGWRARPVEKAGAVFKGSKLQWVWLSPLSPGDTLEVVYSVTVPQDAPRETHRVEGVASSISPGFEMFEIPIPGDAEVSVI